MQLPRVTNYANYIGYSSVIIFFLCLVFGIFVAGTDIGLAEEGVEVRPHIIDERARARDILKYVVKIKNNTERKANLYTLVQEITADGGAYSPQQSNKLDRSNSLTKWIRIKRGAIEIDPGKEVEIPLEIDVSMYARPGKYYASLTFAQGNNVTVARQNMRNGVYPHLMINLNVEEEIIEKVEIKKFRPEHWIYFDFPVNLILTVNNFGNRDVAPAGNIFIYNRSGREVTVLPVNLNGEKIKPESEMTIINTWTEGKGFGKFKAKLELQYGRKQIRDLQDAVYFWILPWRILAGIGGGLFLVVLALVLVIFKKTYFGRDLSSSMAAGRREPVVNLKKNH